MSDPDGREGDGSAEAEKSPVPARGERFGLDLGNPVERETAAFSWLIVIIVAGVTVAAVGKIISPLAAMIWVLILLAIVAVPIFKGLKHQLGSPEDDE